MRLASVLLVAVLMCGCGAACTDERTALEGLRTLSDAAEGTEAAEHAATTLQAAEAALGACEEREDGEWLEHLLTLIVKVGVAALSR